MSAGCATTSTDTGAGPAYQFDPIPVAEVGEEELAPVAPQTIEDLLRAANEHFEAANSAQAKDDHTEALRHYTMMLEQLIEADLDPTVFYQLRSEFARILDSAEGDTRLVKRSELPPWSVQASAPTRSGTRLEYPNPLNQNVLTEISEIEEGYPKNFLRGLERSHRYLPYIQSEFLKAGLPSDLVWLAMVESQFTPRINSRVGAGGMWQFMPGTARRFGLTIDSYVDERYDWKKSTQAAITYLTQLHEMFNGSWPLAVSAYNKGEYGMERAVAMGGGERDLWRLMEITPAANHLPQETRKFYPRLLASAIVAENPRQYGFTPSYETPERSVYVPVSGSLKLTDLEEAAKLPKGTLVALNPQLIRGVTPPGRTTDISVPVEKRALVIAATKATPQAPTGTHVVRRGETLAALAQQHGVTVDALMEENDIKSARKLRVGQRLVIPESGSRQTAPAQVAPAPAAGVQLAVETTPAINRESAQIYKVVAGDTL
ncbi:MAG: transglycosylase SLT domain-containing protein, partial [Candidatus Hydrogenedentales bacterium]